MADDETRSDIPKPGARAPAAPACSGTEYLRLMDAAAAVVTRRELAALRAEVADRLAREPERRGALERMLDGRERLLFGPRGDAR